jgi:hypothetical protein
VTSSIMPKSQTLCHKDASRVCPGRGNPSVPQAGEYGLRPHYLVEYSQAPLHSRGVLRVATHGVKPPLGDENNDRGQIEPRQSDAQGAKPTLRQY